MRDIADDVRIVCLCVRDVVLTKGPTSESGFASLSPDTAIPVVSPPAARFVIAGVSRLESVGMGNAVGTVIPVVSP